MRPLLCAAAILVSGAVAGVLATGVSASTSTPGDGCLVVAGAYGKVTITLTRGVVFGRFSSGTLSYSDVNVDTPSLPTVPGVIPVKTKDHVWTYGPADFVRFRATGPTKLIVNAQSMDLSVAGKGWTSLSRAGFKFFPSTLVPPANAYSVDAASFCGDNFQKMPLTLTKVQIASPVSG